MMGSSMVGSMAGSMIGNTLFGGGGGAPAPAAVEAAPPAGYAPAPAGPTCAMESRHFLECMSQVNDDMNYCRQYYDSFKMCNCAHAHSRPPVPTRAALHHRAAHRSPARAVQRNRRCSKRAALTAACAWVHRGAAPPRLVPPRRTRLDSWCARDSDPPSRAERLARAGFRGDGRFDD